MAFKTGDEVVVYNQNLSGKPIIEGRAIIVKTGEVADQYRVRFLNDGSRKTYLRFVYPGDSQRMPDEYIAKAQAEWAAPYGNVARNHTAEQPI
jgi:hypothetical protein